MAQFRIPGVALVIGSAGGIGREVCLTFAEAGAKGIIVADINLSGAEGVGAEESQTVASNPQYRAVPVHIDVTDEKSVENVMRMAVNEFGRIDYCINAAGISHENFSATEFPEEVFDHVMQVNTKGVWLVCKHVAKVMQGQEPLQVELGRHGKRDLGRGCIVNIASAQATAALAQKSAYVTSKHALTGVTRQFAVEGRPYCIRVNQLNPIWVRTSMYTEMCRKIPTTPMIVEKVVPNKRPIEPDEVASALYLCSPAGAYISGIDMGIDYSTLAGPLIVEELP